jgi:hypothetical protein
LFQCGWWTQTTTLVLKVKYIFINAFGEDINHQPRQLKKVAGKYHSGHYGRRFFILNSYAKVL